MRAFISFSVILFLLQNASASPCNVREPSPNFMGRTEAIKDLTNKIKEGSGLIILTGLAGIGKTQLARRLAHNLKQNYQIIWWFDASHNLESQFKEFALTWNKSQTSEMDKVPVEGLSGFKVWGILKGKVEKSSQSWMLIFDDAQDIRTIQLLLPKTSTRANKIIMITTRDQRLMRDVMKLEPFKRQESIEYLCRVINTDDSKRADELAELLKDHPLALAQAAAYIKTHPSLTIDKYINLYKTQPQHLRKSEDRAQALEDDYKYTVNMTLDISLSEIIKSSRMAYELLMCSALLGHNNIPDSILERAVGSHGKEIEYHEAITELVKHSLLEVERQTKESPSYAIHQLIQDIIRERLKRQELKLWLTRCTEAINQEIPFDIFGLPAHLFKHNYLVQHGKQIISHAEHYSVVAPALALLAIKLMYFSHYYLFDFEYSAKLDHLIETYIKRVRGIHPAAIARYYHTRGNLISITDWNRGVKENLKAVKVVEGLNTEEAKQELFFTLVNNLVDTYLVKGDMKLAFAALDKSHKIIQTATNKKNEYLLWSFYSLAYINKERYTEAYEAIEKALKLIPRAEIPDAVFLFVRVNKAEILIRQGKAEEAFNLSQELYREALKLFGSEDNHMTLRVLLITGMSLAKLKKHEEAIETLRGCITKYDALAKSPHKDPVQALAHRSLGDIYFSQQKFIEAKEEYEIAEQVFDKLYHKKEVEDISYNYLQLVRVGFNLNDEFYYKKYVKKLEKEFGKEHTRTKESYKLIVNLTSKL